VNDQKEALEKFLKTHDYQQAVSVLRGLLIEHCFEALGGDWEKIHYEYGLYTINCRVKSTTRVLQKYDKLSNDKDHPVEVNVKNFYALMPDLVGGRLVVLDPGDLFRLASIVKNYFASPTFLDPNSCFQKLRLRHGKFSNYDPDEFKKDGYDIDVEKSGYSSVHFVYKLSPDFFKKFCGVSDRACVERLDELGDIPIDEWHIEIQVRTIMDEAWGEVDHFIRYEDPALLEDEDVTTHCKSLAGYLQAANNHVQIIRELVRRKKYGN